MDTIVNKNLVNLISENFPLAKTFNIQPEKIYRFDIEKRGNKAGWAVLFSDGNGVIGDWRTGDRTICISPTSTSSDKETISKKIDDFFVEETALFKTKTIPAHLKLKQAEDSHPYLVAKKIKALPGLRKNDCYIEIFGINKNSEITCIQTIDGDGKKIFLPGSKVKGSFFILGQVSEKMYLAEGYATAYSIYEATGKGTIMAFNASNLKSAAEAFLHLHPNTQLTVIADNDRPQPGHCMGIGEEKARQTGLDVVVIPIEGMDANDYVNSGYNLKELLEPSVQKTELDLTFDFEMATELKAPNWLIKRWIAKDCIHIVYGAPASGKSSVVSDMFLAYCNDMPDWHGFKIKKGDGIGVYLCGEGYRGLVSRRFLWTEQHNCDPKGKFVFSKKILPLDTQEGLEKTISEIKKLNKMVDLIVIDTLRKAFSGDENSASDTEKFLNSCKKLSEAFEGAAIIIVAHIGKTGKDTYNIGPRGSSNLTANPDISIAVTRDKSSSIVTLSQIKTKDSEEIPSFNLLMKPLPIKCNNNSGEISSVLIDDCDSNMLPKKIDDWKTGFDLFKAIWKGRLEEGFPFITIKEYLDHFTKSRDIDAKSARNYLKAERCPFTALIQKSQIRKEAEGFFLVDKSLIDTLSKENKC